MVVMALKRVGMLAAVLAGLCALWEAFKWVGETTDLKLGTFVVKLQASAAALAVSPVSGHGSSFSTPAIDKDLEELI